MITPLWVKTNHYFLSSTKSATFCAAFWSSITASVSRVSGGIFSTSCSPSFPQVCGMLMRVFTPCAANENALQYCFLIHSNMLSGYIDFYQSPARIHHHPKLPARLASTGTPPVFSLPRLLGFSLSETGWPSFWVFAFCQSMRCAGELLLGGWRGYLLALPVLIWPERSGSVGPVMRSWGHVAGRGLIRVDIWCGDVGWPYM